MPVLSPQVRYVEVSGLKLIPEEGPPPGFDIV
jgi:hypothetical protein